MFSTMHSQPIPSDSRQAPQPVALHERAADNLAYIRETMERATSFTAVSGRGYVVIGLTAGAAAWLASVQATPAAWLGVWLAELVVAAVIAMGSTVRKAHAEGVPMRSHAGRKLVLAFAPPMLVGGLLTAAAYPSGDYGLVAGIWLGLYGAGVMTAGAYSVRIVPLMGAAFIALAAVALLTPLSSNLLLALGLGGLHVVFGLVIWRRHGG